MQNVGKDYFIRSLTSGLSAKNSRVGMEILQKDFWSAMSAAVKCGKQLRIETLKGGNESVGPSFLLFWGSWSRFEVNSKPLAGVSYQRYLTYRS